MFLMDLRKRFFGSRTYDGVGAGMVDMKVFSSSYTVSSIPAAGFTVLRPVGGQAVVRGALY